MGTPFIGIVMLDTAFPRILGDVGNPATFPFPVRHRVVAGADVPAIVRQAAPDPTLMEGFVAAARELEAEGAVGIVTSCGFLSVAQDLLASSVGVPVIASALSLVPLVAAATGGRPVGIVTADAGSLSPAALAAAGIEPRSVRIAGMEASPHFRRLILATRSEQGRSIDVDAITAETVSVCEGLVHDDPAIGAFVFECTNLQPYAAAVTAATGRPVFGILHAAQTLWTAAQPPRF